MDMAPAIKYTVSCSMDATDASFDCSPRMQGLTKMGEMCKGLFSAGNLSIEISSMTSFSIKTSEIQ